MKIKQLFYAFSAFLVFICLYTESVKAQNPCIGNQIFSEKKCGGDEGSIDEKQLWRLVNEYRASVGLPPVPWSDALSLVANRHLMDLQNNVRTVSHSWSNCPYDSKDQNTWTCVSAAPQRLGSGYTGKGYENVYRGTNAKASPLLALNAWKQSAVHNTLLTNQSFFKNDVFDACGIAIDGGYVILWFGTHTGLKKDIASTNGAPLLETGLGLNLEKAIANLSKSVAFSKISAPSFVNKKWTAASVDKSIILEIYGSESDVSEATIKIRTRLVNNKLAAKTQNVLFIFLGNLIPNWDQRNNWAEDSLQNLLKNPKIKQSFTIDNKLVEMTSPISNFITLTVKPYKKTLPFQVWVKQ